MLVIHEENFDYSTIKFTQEPVGNYRVKYSYVHEMMAFDIETTKLPEIEESFMYIWNLAIEDNFIITGRTWDSFRHCVEQLTEILGERRAMCWVHNLPFEFVFLSGIFEFRNQDIFAVDRREPVKVLLNKHIELRCSYKLTNMSLDRFTGKYNVEHRKYVKRLNMDDMPLEKRELIKRQGVGFDYSKTRYADTPLTHKEWLYVVYDVLGLIEAVRAQMNHFGDTLYSIPLTQTGYPRRTVKSGMQDLKGQIFYMWPEFRCYELLRAAFRGGNTHGSRWYAGEILEGVHSVDESSAYPFAECAKLFPMAPFKHIGDTRRSYVEKLLGRGACFVMLVRLTNIELKNRYTAVPYLSFDKCMPGRIGNRTLFNGRILGADWLEIAITDIDYQIILSQYTCDVEILELWRSWYGRLPDPIINANLEFYKLKTELKGVQGQELYYMNNKEQLNSLYGMSVQNPIQDETLYNGGDWDLAGELPEDLYFKARRSAFQLYQWGVWTTANARQALQRGIEIVGEDQFVYCDTDSVKFLGKADFSEYNAECIRACEEIGAYAADRNGEIHYMGVFEQEPDYIKFIHQGAKRYAYTQLDKKGVERLHITVAGVPKAEGARILADAGGLKAFRDGFIFHGTGKLRSIYNDEFDNRVERWRPHDYTTSDGHTVHLSRNVTLVETDYRIGLTKDFNSIVDESAQELSDIMKYWRKSEI